MKKIFFALCAVAALASCSNNEIVNLDQEAIAFDNAFVDNGTRAADNFTIETNKLFDFNVWATTQRPEQAGVAQPIVPILANEAVSRANASSPWGYATDKTQYWIPGNTYQFVAVKNGTVNESLVNGLPATITYDATSQADLLYARDTRVGLQSGNAAVSFTFNHLLAKAYFTVKTLNMSGNNPNYTYVIKNVMVNNAAKVATCDVAGNVPVWAAATEFYNVGFGHVYSGAKLKAKQTYTSDFARLLIPAAYDNSLNITFTIETLYGDAVIDSRDYNETLSYEFKRNYEYNFVLELGNPGEEIKFSVNKVEGWKYDTATVPSI